jgi:3-hydroxyisobutyrate dehydrogenase-like beta-hydroxyacid dehydrogenase
MVVGLLHPGEMGAGIGRELRAAGHEVLWAGAGRSPETAARAGAAGLQDAGDVGSLVARAGVVLSVCPPHAAVELARTVGPLQGVYVDCNAIAPATARQVAGLTGPRTVDGGIMGRPPSDDGGSPTLALSGPGAAAIAGLFAGSRVRARVIGDEVGAASALKASYAAWTKGSAALLLACGALARAEGVADELLVEWEHSHPQVPAAAERAAAGAHGKSWRWIGEMEELAAAFASAGLPDGFHRAAAEVYERLARTDPATFAAAAGALASGDREH